MLDGFSSGGLDKVFDGHRRYTVPPYQRGYAWTVDEVEEFLDDLEYATERDDKHFFGFMLTVSDSNDTDKAIKIIDGQQRLSTVMMFLICARNHFKHDNTPKAQEYQTMLENIIRTSEYETKPTFTLGRTNQNLFKEIFLRVPIDRQILDCRAKVLGKLCDLAKPQAQAHVVTHAQTPQCPPARLHLAAAPPGPVRAPNAGRARSAPSRGGLTAGRDPS